MAIDANKNYSKQTETCETVLPKIRYYCSFQERCHQEVRDKLYGFGLHLKDVEFIISGLIEENYLNEERFAIQYAGGKFRMKQWGKIKIHYELKSKGISNYLIKKALKQIDLNDYEKVFNKLATQKLKTLQSEKNHFSRKRKLQDFLLQKGYERNLISPLIQQLNKA